MNTTRGPSHRRAATPAGVTAAALVTLAGVSAQGAWVGIETITVRDDRGDGSFFTVDFEENYLPNVVWRENGNASFEALKAQAVAARSFAYYKLQANSYIRNDTSDQLYSYGGVQPDPGGLWAQAVRETEGEILSFNHVLTATFYVAGAVPSGPTPRAHPGDNDYSNTEQWVTYPHEDGLLGSANRGSPLGFQGALANRGAKSQNGADFQSDRGVHYYDILKYYYGGDIQLEQVVPGAGQQPHGVKTLAGFERNHDYFARSLTFAGQTQNLGGGTTVARSGSFARSGNASQVLTFDHDEAADAQDGVADGFFARHISGVERASQLSNVTTGTVQSGAARPVGNVILESVGSIGFWLMVNPLDAVLSTSLEVALAIDDFDDPYGSITTEEGAWMDVIVDGAWHKYEWFLDDEAAWSSAFGPGIGDGQIASRFTMDSILFRGLGDVAVYLDDVFYDPAAVKPIPEPATLMMLAAAGGAVGLRRERRRYDN